VEVDEAVSGLPAPPLREFVAWYTGYRQAGVPTARHRGLPSPFLTLILTLDEPLTMLSHPDPRDPPGDYQTLLGGLHTTPALISVPGRQSGVQIALRPFGARVLLGLPAGELAGADIPADAVFGGEMEQVHDRLRSAADWTRRFAEIDTWLAGRLASGTARTPAPEVRRAWELLLRTGGTIGVGDLAAEVGWSDRHLRSQLAAETGLTPKAAARVIRFTRARREIVGGATLADVAAACGYFDQAHLDREFRALAGCAPSRWLSEEFRNIQSGHHEPGSGLEHD
jgi:AraC-like DNA-binding protein